MRIELEQTAAVVIDYQEKLMPVMAEREAVTKQSVMLLSGLQLLGVPMYLTQQYTKGLGMTISPITDAAGTKEYIDKITFSGFDSVKELVQGKKFIIVCGIEAHICVLQTVLDLQAAGYIPVLVEDCIDSRVKHNKNIAVERARGEGAIITTCESLLFELLQSAGTDISKQIQKLIK